MRTIKDPDTRRQEIMDAAVELLYEKGYEKTSIADIAQKLGIAQGLCYRYFPSKEVIFHSALEYYADRLVERMRPVLCNPSLTLAQKILQTPTFAETESDHDYYFKVSHSLQNRDIHDQLFLLTGRKLMPLVAEQIRLSNVRGETHFSDPEAVASFCVFGEYGLFADETIPVQERIDRARAFMLDLLSL